MSLPENTYVMIDTIIRGINSAIHEVLSTEYELDEDMDSARDFVTQETVRIIKECASGDIEILGDDNILGLKSKKYYKDIYSHEVIMIGGIFKIKKNGINVITFQAADTGAVGIYVRTDDKVNRKDFVEVSELEFERIEERVRH